MSSSKIIARALLLAGCLLMCALPTAWCEQEEILTFDSVVEIHPTGSLTVTETLIVRAARQEIQRGIYRDFPITYTTPWGLRRTVGFQVLRVLRNGNPEPWSVNDEVRPGNTRVYIGDPDHLLTPGVHTYTLQYETDRQLVLGPEADELYWNVTGNEWAFPIQQARVRIVLPGGAPLLGISAYTGMAGERGQSWRALPAPEGEAIVETTQPLLPREGFTVSVTWPKGFVADSANPFTARTLAEDNFFLFAGAGLMLVVLLYYLAAWGVLGRDPAPGPIIPQYGPPEGFTPSAVRFVYGLGKCDDRSFASAILQLAVAGALQIIKNENYTLLKTDASPNLLPGQQQFLQTLFSGGQQLALQQTNHATLRKARRELERWLRADFEKRYFLRNSAWWIGGLLLSLVPAGLALLQAGEIIPALFMMVWLTGWTAGVTAMLSNIFSMVRRGQILLAIPLSLFSVPFLIGWVAGCAALLFFTSPWILGIFVFGAGLNLVFYHLLKAPTLAGRRVMDHIEGFRHYLSVAEKDRLDSLPPPEQTPELFEKFLPYAVALEVEQKWADRFTDILNAQTYQPAWCSGTGWSGGTPGSGIGSTSWGTTLGTALGTGMVSSLSAASTAPGSRSGSGGGGSSGGGGGGGGGGGW